MKKWIISFLIAAVVCCDIMMLTAIVSRKTRPDGIKELADMEVSKLVKLFPVIEVEILNRVAGEYSLNEHETALLFAIRKVENGRDGLEMGCGDGIPNHPARRFAGDFEKSLDLQARYAAGTIKKRYTGDLLEFAKIYCERPAHWYTLISGWVVKIGTLT